MQPPLHSSHIQRTVSHRTPGSRDESGGRPEELSWSLHKRPLFSSPAKQVPSPGSWEDQLQLESALPWHSPAHIAGVIWCPDPNPFLTHITVHFHTRSTLMPILSPFSWENLGHGESKQLALGHTASWGSGGAENQTGWLQNSSPCWPHIITESPGGYGEERLGVITSGSALGPGGTESVMSAQHSSHLCACLRSLLLRGGCVSPATGLGLAGGCLPIRMQGQVTCWLCASPLGSPGSSHGIPSRCGRHPEKQIGLDRWWERGPGHCSHPFESRS